MPNSSEFTIGDSAAHLPPKKGVIRAKHNVIAEPRTLLDVSAEPNAAAQFNLSQPDFGNISH